MCMYAYAYEYTYIYIHVHIYVYIYIYICVCTPLEERRVLLETLVPVPQLRHRLELKLRFAAIHIGANCAV